MRVTSRVTPSCPPQSTKIGPTPLPILWETVAAQSSHVDSRVLLDCGHYPAEDALADFLAVLLAVLLSDSEHARDEPSPE
jgi:hypothetical protein